MSRLGQWDYFADVGDFSTDVFDWSAVDLDYGWDTLDLTGGDYFGLDEFSSYDFDSVETIGYDVADPFYTTQYGGDQIYDPALTMADDYGDLYAPPEYELSSFDPSSGVGIGDEAYIDWAAWEESGAEELEASFGGSTETAIAAFSEDSPDVDWKYWADKGENIYKMYQKMTQPAGAKPGTKPTYMIDPVTGKPILAVRDPRTGQLVPAVRDPRTGQLVPRTAGLDAADIPQGLLYLGIAAAVYFYIMR
jgi:hypothetical protein